MFDDRHTPLPQGTRPETDIHPVDVGRAGDLRDAQSLPRGSKGPRIWRNWFVAAAAGAIVVGTGVWIFSAHLAMPERGTDPPSVVTVALPLLENVTNRTELTGQ